MSDPGEPFVMWFPSGGPVERRPDGSLPSFTSVGSYAIVYVTRASDVLCASCAGAPDAAGPLIASPYMEGPSYECEGCGTMIESSYGDPDAPKGEDLSNPGEDGWPQTREGQLVWACCVSTIGGPCAHKRHMSEVATWA